MSEFLSGALVALLFAAVFLGAIALVRDERHARKPSLIDLQEYEAELLDASDTPTTLRPPPAIPHLVMGEWTADDMHAMRQNRRLAQEIYERVSRRVV